MVKNIGLTIVPPKRTCEDELCPFHGKLPIRGKSLVGTAVSCKAHKMIVVSRDTRDQFKSTRDMKEVVLKSMPFFRRV